MLLVRLGTAGETPSALPLLVSRASGDADLGSWMPKYPLPSVRLVVGIGGTEAEVRNMEKGLSFSLVISP